MDRVDREAVLLDTCAVIFFAEGSPMLDSAVARLEQARRRAGILVSPISAWEIGLLSRKGQVDGLRFDPDPETWLAKVRSAQGIGAAPFTFQIGLGASSLPEPLHNDPADRLLIATARQLGIPIVTRDRLILGYGKAGHVLVVPC